MRLSRRRRRIVLYFSVIVGLIVAYTFLYYLGMSVLENRPRSLLQSFAVVIETMTTTGYGNDAPWSHPLMVALVSLMQFTGIASVFLTLEVFQEQAIQRALNVRPTTSISDDLQDHIIVCGYSEYTSFLIDELESDEQETVLVVDDKERAVTLEESGRRVVYGNPEDEGVLRAAGIERAAHIIADVEDTRNTSVILAARDVTDSISIVAVAEDRGRREYYEYAGAETVITPRTLAGKSLAEKASTAVQYDVGEGTPLGDDIRVREVPVPNDSDLEDVHVRDSDIGEETGVTIVGLWKDGELEMPPSPDTVLSETTVLVVAGTDEQFDNLKTYLTQPRVPTQYDTVVIAGAGATGTAAEEHLDKNNVSSVTIDTDESQNPDIVGDITKREVLEEAGIESAGGYIIAVSDDPDTLSSILLARHTRDDIEIAVSVLSNEAVRKAQQAGADYALSTPNVAGRLLAKEIQGLDYIDPTTQIRIAEVQAPKLVGKTLEEADVRSRTGCTVIAIERDGKTIVDVRPETDIQEDDELLVVGTDEEVHQFLSLFRGDDD